MGSARGPGEGLTTVVGVAAGEAAAVRRSIEFLALHTPLPFTLLRLHQAGAIGFNELIECDADLVVQLEAGAIVGPRWLELLTAALARTGAGLAGPSTNRAWNEQGCVTPTAGGQHAGSGSDEVKAVRHDAMLVLRRFGSAVRTLAPLYSLSDFCYAVRREVIDAIGAADPAYADGPCWEMDYNIRAARAGFEGIWVSGAYVRRTRKAPSESRELLQRNKELYQDRFCGRRLRGVTEAYEPHCRGAACADFAPRGLITLRPTPPSPRPALAPRGPAPASATEPTPAIATPRAPLVSCVMPTRDRLEFAAQSVRYFLSQDYPNSELVIVDDGSGDLPARLPSDPRIRLVRGDQASRTGRNTIGALRNAGTAIARGEIIVCWDDDDWHGPTRVSDQVGPILAGDADLTGLADVEWFEPATGRAWRLTPELHRRLLYGDVYGGTIAFRRSLWRRSPFPDRSIAEDAQFLERAVRGGARLRRLDANGRYVYVRHPQNSWRLTPGQAGRRDGWIPIPAPALPSGDLEFYAGLVRPAPQQDESPQVSCIMPTYNRRAYVARSIEYFLRQDYPAKELVILDDGDDAIGDLVPEVAGIRYHRLEQRTVLGTKRNLACELASGAFIAHWDDDDWQARDRLSVQASRLTGGADLCGAGSLLFWDPQGNQAWRYTWPSGRRGWAAGTSLCYPKSLWRRNPFPEVPIGEDTRFVWQSAVRRLADVREANCVVGLVHAANTVPKRGRGSYWARTSINEVTQCLGSDVTFYQGLRLGS